MKLTAERLMRLWKSMDRARAEAIVAEDERHARECPCSGGAGWRANDYGSPLAAIGFCEWMDHLAVRTEGGRRVYTAQPYYRNVDMTMAETDFESLRALGWEVVVSYDDSTHVPGATVLITMTARRSRGARDDR